MNAASSEPRRDVADLGTRALYIHFSMDSWLRERCEMPKDLEGPDRDSFGYVADIGALLPLLAQSERGRGEPRRSGKRASHIVMNKICESSRPRLPDSVCLGMFRYAGLIVVSQQVRGAAERALDS